MGLGLSHVPHLALSWPLPLMALLDPVHVLHIMSVRMDSIRMDSTRMDFKLYIVLFYSSRCR